MPPRARKAMGGEGGGDLAEPNSEAQASTGEASASASMQAPAMSAPEDEPGPRAPVMQPASSALKDKLTSAAPERKPTSEASEKRETSAVSKKKLALGASKKGPTSSTSSNAPASAEPDVTTAPTAPKEKITSIKPKVKNTSTASKEKSTSIAPKKRTTARASKKTESVETTTMDPPVAHGSGPAVELKALFIGPSRPPPEETKEVEAQESDAEESDAEQSDAQESDAEQSDAQESNDEEADAEQSDAREADDEDSDDVDSERKVVSRRPVRILPKKLRPMSPDPRFSTGKTTQSVPKAVVPENSKSKAYLSKSNSPDARVPREPDLNKRISTYANQVSSKAVPKASKPAPAPSKGPYQFNSVLPSEMKFTTRANPVVAPPSVMDEATEDKEKATEDENKALKEKFRKALRAMEGIENESKELQDFAAKFRDKSIYPTESAKYEAQARMLAIVFRHEEKALIEKAGSDYRNDNDSATPSMPEPVGYKLQDLEICVDDARATVERIALLIPKLPSSEDRLAKTKTVTDARVILWYLSVKCTDLQKDAALEKEKADAYEELSEQMRQAPDPTQFDRYRELYTQHVGTQVGLQQDAEIRRVQIHQAKFRRRWARIAPNTNAVLPGETEKQWWDRRGKVLGIAEPKEEDWDKPAGNNEGEFIDVRSEGHVSRGTSVLGTESLDEVIREVGDYPEGWVKKNGQIVGKKD